MNNNLCYLISTSQNKISRTKYSYIHACARTQTHTHTHTHIYIYIIRTRFELPTHYVDGLRPKKSKNNEFVESGSENWALVNKMNTGKDLDDKRMKIKKVMLKISSSAKFEEVCSFILLKSSITSFFFFESLLVSPFFSDPLISFPLFSFIPPLLFISTFHLYARWLVLILVPSALPISPHVVAVRLKHSTQASLLH